MIRSIEQGMAAAMLLGPHWRYDPNDHTFNNFDDIYDADTMEYLGVLYGAGIRGYGLDQVSARSKRVRMGEIGINAED